MRKLSKHTFLRVKLIISVLLLIDTAKKGHEVIQRLTLIHRNYEVLPDVPHPIFPDYFILQ